MNDLDLQDNFENGPDRKIWSLKRIESENCLSTEQYLGKSCLKITVDNGDVLGRGNDGKVTERTELTEHDQLQISTNTPIWYALTFSFPQDFPVIQNRLVFSQWKQSTRRPESPFLSCRYINGTFIFQVVYDDTRVRFEKAVDLRGAWHTIHVNYELRDNKSGFGMCWLDGEEIASYEGTLGSSIPISDLIMFKLGMYRDQIDIPQSIYFSGYRRSNTRLI